MSSDACALSSTNGSMYHITYIFILTHTRVGIDTYTNTHTHADTQPALTTPHHPHPHPQPHTHTHTHPHIHTHTHTHEASVCFYAHKNSQTPDRKEGAEDRQPTVTFIIPLPPIFAKCICVCLCGWGEGCQTMNAPPSHTCTPHTGCTGYCGGCGGRGAMCTDASALSSLVCKWMYVDTRDTRKIRDMRHET